MNRFKSLFIQHLEEYKNAAHLPKESGLVNNNIINNIIITNKSIHYG